MGFNSGFKGLIKTCLLSFLLDYALGASGINYKYKHTYAVSMKPIHSSNMAIVLLFVKLKAPGLFNNDVYE